MDTHYSPRVAESLARLNHATGIMWEHETTGGGHDGFLYSPPGTSADAYYFVTVADDARAPITAEEWQGIALGWYDDDADDLPDGFRIIPEVTNLATLADYFEGGEG